jgi:Ca2+-binding EF-hand superfamily protein
MDAMSKKLPPESTSVLELASVRKLYNVDLQEAKEMLKRFSKINKKLNGKLDYEEFCDWLQLSRNIDTLKLFQLFDIENTGIIDFRVIIIIILSSLMILRLIFIRNL